VRKNLVVCGRFGPWGKKRKPRAENHGDADSRRDGSAVIGRTRQKAVAAEVIPDAPGVERTSRGYGNWHGPNEELASEHEHRAFMEVPVADSKITYDRLARRARREGDQRFLARGGIGAIA